MNEFDEYEETCPWCELKAYGQQDDDGTWHCEHCNGWLSASCDTCAGEGFVYEDEYECDWINNTHDIITCPTCGGNGRVTPAMEYTPEQLKAIREQNS